MKNVELHNKVMSDFIMQSNIKRIRIEYFFYLFQNQLLKEHENSYNILTSGCFISGLRSHFSAPLHLALDYSLREITQELLD